MKKWKVEKEEVKAGFNLNIDLDLSLSKIDSLPPNISNTTSQVHHNR